MIDSKIRLKLTSEYLSKSETSIAINGNKSCHLGAEVPSSVVSRQGFSCCQLLRFLCHLRKKKVPWTDVLTILQISAVGNQHKIQEKMSQKWKISFRLEVPSLCGIRRYQQKEFQLTNISGRLFHFC